MTDINLHRRLLHKNRFNCRRALEMGKRMVVVRTTSLGEFTKDGKFISYSDGTKKDEK